MFFGCKLLEDGYTLSDYKIQEKNTIIFALRLSGGGPGIKFNSLSNEITGHCGKFDGTELNKHKSFTPGVNIVAICKN